MVVSSAKIFNFGKWFRYNNTMAQLDMEYPQLYIRIHSVYVCVYIYIVCI